MTPRTVAVGLAILLQREARRCIIIELDRDDPFRGSDPDQLRRLQRLERRAYAIAMHGIPPESRAEAWDRGLEAFAGGEP